MAICIPGRTDSELRSRFGLNESDPDISSPIKPTVYRVNGGRMLTKCDSIGSAAVKNCGIEKRPTRQTLGGIEWPL